ncbi:MAG: hypothetical protein JXP73_07950 [Deltaproteobacteria bacterium]|nr:hypothetical protein [Deltaproteobacteria bacterium]
MVVCPVNLVSELFAIAGALARARIRHALCLVLDFLLERAAFAGLLANPIEVALPEGTLWVVTRDVLLAMKRPAGRHQDLADLEKLEEGRE